MEDFCCSSFLGPAARSVTLQWFQRLSCEAKMAAKMAGPADEFLVKACEQ